MDTRCLIKQGYTKTLPVFGSFMRGDMNVRHTGYLQAVEEAGLKPVDPIFVIGLA